ncbi:hypothetical protein LXA43DRAFT_994930 [Ganoderma leucocontextum]|nr:hypothetical protein LXA43DRAFT_994930 [Ganoderma leucocontextum]
MRSHSSSQTAVGQLQWLWCWGCGRGVYLPVGQWACSPCTWQAEGCRGWPQPPTSDWPVHMDLHDPQLNVEPSHRVLSYNFPFPAIFYPLSGIPMAPPQVAANFPPSVQRSDHLSAYAMQSSSILVHPPTFPGPFRDRSGDRRRDLYQAGGAPNTNGHSMVRVQAEHTRGDWNHRAGAQRGRVGVLPSPEPPDFVPPYPDRVSFCEETESAYPAPHSPPPSESATWGWHASGATVESRRRPAMGRRVMEENSPVERRPPSFSWESSDSHRVLRKVRTFFAALVRLWRPPVHGRSTGSTARLSAW